MLRFDRRTAFLTAAGLLTGSPSSALLFSGGLAVVLNAFAGMKRAKRCKPPEQ